MTCLSNPSSPLFLGFAASLGLFEVGECGALNFCESTIANGRWTSVNANPMRLSRVRKVKSTKTGPKSAIAHVVILCVRGDMLFVCDEGGEKGGRGSIAAIGSFPKCATVAC